MDKRDLTKARTPTDLERQYQFNNIKNAVQKESGKGLSSNDFTDDYIHQIERNTKNRHIHGNMSVLNNLSSEDIDKWNALQDTEIYTLFEGDSTTAELSDEPTNYDMVAIIYGNGTFSDVKLSFIEKDTQFYLSLDTSQNTTEKSLCSVSSKTLTSESLNIQKVIAFKFKKGVI